MACREKLVDGFKAGFEHYGKCYFLLLKFVGIDAYLCGIGRIRSNIKNKKSIMFRDP
jgi:hypothetical protein